MRRSVFGLMYLPASTALNTPGAVSYTHLDVYKRQYTLWVSGFLVCAERENGNKNIARAKYFVMLVKNFALKLLETILLQR